ncbi:hypothetical protein K504DRAFT_26113 [Pleomassaria siparia CBS 279.74]|uniref:Uncharacterized protein n=1 Tax=Pleomassaria siparia CBS 279.74 TaxID=1314801 RepID=A0A6G1KR87_9PLEO|nr:hypothetical protein K504DRAFT_26113 [Pleomassaria siparia CBS 279.74]
MWYGMVCIEGWGITMIYVSRAHAWPCSFYRPSQIPPDHRAPQPPFQSICPNENADRRVRQLRFMMLPSATDVESGAMPDHVQKDSKRT